MLLSPVQDQDLVVNGFGLQGCILTSSLQAQAARGQALSVGDPRGQPGRIKGVSVEPWQVEMLKSESEVATKTWKWWFLGPAKSK